METIIELFDEHLAAFLIVLLVLFVCICFLFARDRFLSMVVGLLRLLASFFYSPFIYLKRAILGLAEYGKRGEAEFTESKQYLLNKLMISLQGLAVVLSIALLAGNLVSGWNQMIPQKFLRDQISSMESELTQQQAELRDIGPAVKKMESDWADRHDALVKTYTQERAKRSEAASTENTDLANRIAQLGDTVQQNFTQIRDYYAQNEYDNTPSTSERINTEVRDYVDRMEVSDAAKELMRKYNDNWYFVKLSGVKLNDMSESQLRSAIQPTYTTLKKRQEHLDQVLPEKQTELDGLKKEMKYDVEALVLQIVYGVLQSIALLWAIGLFIETLSLTVQIAANVEKIRDGLAKK